MTQKQVSDAFTYTKKKMEHTFLTFSINNFCNVACSSNLKTDTWLPKHLLYIIGNPLLHQTWKNFLDTRNSEVQVCTVGKADEDLLSNLVLPRIGAVKRQCIVSPFARYWEVKLSQHAEESYEPRVILTKGKVYWIPTKLSKQLQGTREATGACFLELKELVILTFALYPFLHTIPYYKQLQTLLWRFQRFINTFKLTEKHFTSRNGRPLPRSVSKQGQSSPKARESESHTHQRQTHNSCNFLHLKQKRQHLSYCCPPFPKFQLVHKSHQTHENEPNLTPNRVVSINEYKDRVERCKRVGRGAGHKPQQNKADSKNSQALATAKFQSQKAKRPGSYRLRPPPHRAGSRQRPPWPI